ncbi:hypothetical protein ACFXP3_25290 [Streptomyces sp. NPDC059096]|uniref:hypothetical protein n=1 Tax=Streptomyces sp. NPDC059096 TaxID=3346727 RepID=UPI0036984926
MTSTSRTPGTIEATTALLRSELPQLESHQQALEKELATVTERLESVRTALGALQALSPVAEADGAVAPVAAPVVAEPAPEPRLVAPRTAPESVPAEEPTAAEAPAKEAPAAKAPAEKAPARGKARGAARTTKAAAGSETRTKAGTAAKPAKETKRRPAKKTAPAKSAKAAPAKKTAPTAGDPQGAGLTDQILAILAAAGGDPVRARDVAAQLGRDATPGSINAVRSTLDRLVGTSRAHRAGRGLYQASGS